MLQFCEWDFCAFLLVWSSDNIEELKGRLLCTDWDIFFLDANINSATDSITANISLCVNLIIPQKTVKRYLNDKPCITKDIKECIKKKKRHRDQEI